MRRLWCLIVGHDPIPVRRVGTVPRPGGILAIIDGYATFTPDPDGEHRACTRCQQVLE